MQQKSGRLATKLSSKLNWSYCTVTTELHAGNTSSLLHLIYDNKLQEVSSETKSLLKIVITPGTTAESEKLFNTKSIKTFTWSIVLNALPMLSFENELIHGLLDSDERVIEKFSQMKDRCASFLFKKWAMLVRDPLFVISYLKKYSFFNYIYIECSVQVCPILSGSFKTGQVYTSQKNQLLLQVR